MIASVDGATAARGTLRRARRVPPTAPCSGRCASFADVILVGAGTMRDEHYGPPSLPDRVTSTGPPRPRAARGPDDRGHHPPRRPRLETTPFFTRGPEARSCSPSRHPRSRIPSRRARRATSSSRATNNSTCGRPRRLARHGYHDVLVEGGPTINGRCSPRATRSTSSASPSRRRLGGGRAPASCVGDVPEARHLELVVDADRRRLPLPPLLPRRRHGRLTR